MAGRGLPAAGVSAELLLRGGFRDGEAGLLVSMLNSYYVFLKYVKLFEMQRLARAEEPRGGRHRGLGRPRADPRPVGRAMFSLHVDTARSWRGGQNQVLVTVLGLRALGHRTVLVAHPTGELRQPRGRRARPDPAGAADRDGSQRGVAAVAA